tara:strand:+ start:79898 stop:81784 length:1887 start_codon:yes stop_codon:yes gene_type:complete
MNYVFLGDSPTLETGFARVTKNIIPNLELPNKHVWGIGYRGLPHDYNFNIYPANINSSWLDQQNKERFEQFLMALEGPIVLWCIHDAFRLAYFKGVLERVKQQKELTIVAYMPVDSYLDEKDGEFIPIVDIPVAYTEFGAENIRRFTDKEVKVIPHGNDQDFVKIEGFDRTNYFPQLHQGLKLMGVVNSNSERKNLFRSMQIFRELVIKDDSWRLYLHCDPNGFFRLKKIAEEMGIQQFVVYGDPYFNSNIIGDTACDKQELINIYNCFDLFLSTSHGEGWGLTATEAASCGVPLALHRTTAHEEIFNDDSCIFLPSSHKAYYDDKILGDLDPIESADIIHREFQTRNLDHQIKKAKEIVDSYCWDEINETWEDTLLEAGGLKLVTQQKYLVSSGMRVGSTMLGSLVADITKKPNCEYIFVDKLGLDNFFRYFHDLSADKWYKSHSILPQDFNNVLSKCEGLKILNITRNTQDALASRFYYSYKHSPNRGSDSDILREIKEWGDSAPMLEKDIILRSVKERGAVHRWYNELMVFTEEVNNQRVITLNYDKLISGDEEEINRLLNFCGSSQSVDSIKNWFPATFEKSQKYEIETSNRSGDALFFRKGADSNGSDLFDENIMEELEKSVN